MRHAGKDVVIWTQGRSPRTWRASGLCQTRQCWSSKRVKFCTLSWIRMVLNRNRTHEICPWLGEAGERLHLSASVISSVKRGEPSCTGRREDSVRPREAWTPGSPGYWPAPAAIGTAASLSTASPAHDTQSTWECPFSSCTGFLPHGWVRTATDKPEMPATRPRLGLTGEGAVLLQGNVLDVMSLQSPKFTLMVRLNNMWKH